MKQLPLSILIGMLLLLVSCGEYVDAPEVMQKGYIFRSDDSIARYHNGLFGSDSTVFGFSDFEVVDTLPKFGKYEVVLYAGRAPIPIFSPSSSRKARVESSDDIWLYGVADFDHSITIFPAYSNWYYVAPGIYAFKKFPINKTNWGLLHVRGEVITDFDYLKFEYDSLSNAIYGFISINHEDIDTIAL